MESMKLGRAAALGLFLTVLVVPGCGDDDAGPSAESACRQLTSVVCDKVYTCLTAEELALAGEFGSTEEECRTLINAENSCAEDVQCEEGEYNAAKADDCLDAFRALSCANLRAGTTPAVCDEVCE